MHVNLAKDAYHPTAESIQGQWQLIALLTCILEEEMTQVVHANARARVYDYTANEDSLTPLSPPPRPQARPSMVRGIPTATAARAAAYSERHHSTLRIDDNRDDDDDVAPQPAPVPHVHPLASLARFSTNGSSSRLHSKRLNPAFFNRERIAAFTEKENRDDHKGEQQEDDDEHRGPQRLYSSRVLQRKMQELIEEEAPAALSDLEEEEKILAATDASHWRHELHPLPLTTTTPAPRTGTQQTAPPDSALARARVRKVRKQVDPKWLQVQNDAANRPRGPLERDDELHLREALMQTTVSELLSAGVLFDDDDAKQVASFPPVQKPSLPVYSSGTTGLPGCCFDAWSY